MRLRRSDLAIVFFVILFVAYLIFAVIYVNQKQDQDAVKSDIEMTTEQLDDSYERSSDLEQQLAAVEAQLDAGLALFTSDLNSTSILDTIIDLAEANQVKIVTTRSQLASEKQVGGRTFIALPFYLRAEGEFSQLMVFLAEMEKETFDTIVIKSVKFAQGTDSFTLDLQFLIYICPLGVGGGVTAGEE